MAQIETISYAYPVESINRKMTLRINTASDTERIGKGAERTTVFKPVSRYMGGGTRIKSRKDMQPVRKNYMFVRFNKRSTPASPEELAVRTRFGFVATWRAATIKSPTLAIQVVSDYKAGKILQGVSPFGLTFQQYVYYVRMKQYDGGVTTTTDPSYNQWPTA